MKLQRPSLARQPALAASKPHLIASLSVIILAALALSSCAGAGQATQPVSGQLLVAGSTALQPLVTDAAKTFMQQHPQAHITVQGGGSYVGLDDVTSADPKTKVDIGDSDIYADPAVYPDPNLTDHLVCVIPFAMVVNPDVTVADLTPQQLVDIFSTGKITNWDKVGGPNLPIAPIVRTPKSGTRAIFRRYILGGLDEKSNLQTIDSSQDVLKAVATTPGAISYLALSVADSSVHVLDISGVAPTTPNITTGKYPFWGFEHMYTLGDDSDPLLKAFIGYMFSAAVQDRSRALKYIPIAAMQLPLAAASPGGGGVALSSSSHEVGERARR